MKKILGGVSAMAATMLVATACAGGGGGEASSDGESYSWDFTVTAGENSTWYAGAEKFGELVDERSDGRMQINLFANEQLSGGDQLAGAEQLVNGDKALAYYSPIIYSGIDPRFGVVTAPFLYDSVESVDAVLAGEGHEVYDELMTDLGIEFLGFGESGFRQLTSNTPVSTPEDLAGMKIRVAGSSLFLDIYRELGADPTAMNFAEVFTSLQNGTIDGQENPVDTLYTAGLNEVQDYVTRWNYVYDPILLGMNQEVFDGLSPEDQEIVTEAAAEANAFQIDLNRERAEEQFEELSTDMELIDLNEDELEAFRDAMEPVYDDYMDVWTEENFDRLQPQS